MRESRTYRGLGLYVRQKNGQGARIRAENFLLPNLARRTNREGQLHDCGTMFTEFEVREELDDRRLWKSPRPDRSPVERVTVLEMAEGVVAAVDSNPKPAD